MSKLRFEVYTPEKTYGPFDHRDQAADDSQGDRHPQIQRWQRL